MAQTIQYDTVSPSTTDALIQDERRQVNREWYIKIAAGLIIFFLLVVMFFMSSVDEYICYWRINEIKYTKDSVYITVGHKTFTSVRKKN